MANKELIHCPCGQLDAAGRRLDFAQCCGPYLTDFLACSAADAQALMRSRYTAFVLERADYLLATWHASTRPAELSFEPGVKWLGLEVRAYRKIDEAHAQVEFIARYREAGGRAVRLQESSQFVREISGHANRWFYVSGEAQPGAKGNVPDTADQTPAQGPPIAYIERTHAWYDALGYGNPYQYAHYSTTPFQPLTQALSKTCVTLITTAALYQADKGPQDASAPYNASAKFFKVYSAGTCAEHDVRVSHVAVDRAHLSNDSNTWFPLPAMHRAVQLGLIGALTPNFHGVPTNRSQRHTLEVDCPEVLQRCLADGAQAAVLVANCPVCHQSLSLVARHLEANGIATVLMGAAKDIVQWCGVPRFLFSDVPLGNAAGLPYDTDSQDKTLALALELLQSAQAANTTLVNPIQWKGAPQWRQDYLNLQALGPDEIAKQRAENDRIKALAQSVRDSSLSADPTK